MADPQPTQQSLYVPENVNSAVMTQLGTTLGTTYEQYKKDRKGVEEQWMRNLRQFRGIYDPEIASSIPEDQSTAYPKITRTKVIGTVARLMEMLFPRTDKNYEVMASPLPTLSQADVQSVLDQLVQEKPNTPLTDDMIEAGILSLAQEKAKRMDKTIEDQLVELDYVTLAKRVVFSGVLYGVGILKGPMLKTEEGRTWSVDATGAYKAATLKKKKPFFENVSVWDYYTDLSARGLDATDFDFERMIFTRTQVKKLGERPDFMPAAIDAYLAANLRGNYTSLWWETEMRSKSADRQNVSDLEGRKFEVVSAWGRVTGAQLKACGLLGVPDDQLTAEIEVNVWTIGATIIKATLNPYEGKIRGFHHFIYEEDDINLLGNGLPVVMRDSQMAICESARMILDNGSVVCGGMIEVHEGLLKPGGDLDIYGRKVWLREDNGGYEAGVPAVRDIQMNSHITELIQITELFQGFADAETALPPSALGDVSGQGKEALRTSGNLSMLLGAAALPIRDTVRNFDRFTVSFVSSLVEWNMAFNPDDSIKGDANVIARGATSLIAKEVRAASLDQFWSTLDPDDKIYMDRRKVLLERMRVRDLPDGLLEDPDVVAQKLKEAADNAAAQASQNATLLQMQVREGAAAAFKDLMLGLKAQAGANADTFNSLVGGILNVRAAQQPDTAAGGSAPQSGARAAKQSGSASARAAA